MPETPSSRPRREPGVGSLPDGVASYASRHAMFPVDTRVVALVSGGADSVAMLRLLADDWPGESESPVARDRLTVLHVNHVLRGAESDADQAFVEALCEELGIHVVCVRFDVAAYAETEGLNLEDAGRRVRYRFAEEELDLLCDAAGLPRGSGRIAVAHTLDDRVETFFMRALTGAGSGGLSSISPVRGRIVRPLLGTDRSEVRDWLRSLDQTWREDSTNEDVQRFRALVRHELLPLAESVNPRFRTSLATTLDLLADDDALLDEMAQAFARDFAHIDASTGTVDFDRCAMLTLSRPMLRRTVRAALHLAYPDSSRLEFAHVEALAEGFAVEGFAHDLPGGLRARSEYGRMLVTRTPEAPMHITSRAARGAWQPRFGPCGFPHGRGSRLHRHAWRRRFCRRRRDRSRRYSCGGWGEARRSDASAGHAGQPQAVGHAG